eukprot:m.79265 g.79265  ORF g.79265 m.79265 type:complete len:332 (-) comp14513_c0_seq1:619-1614(-)
MTAFLPPMLLDLFRASAPIAPVPGSELQVEPWQRKYKGKMIGVAGYLDEFEKEPKKAEGRMVEPRQYRKERKRQEAEARHKPALEAALAEWKPKENEALSSDAYKTLFVGRLSFAVTEAKLQRELEQYGPIKSVSIVKDKDGKPRGYAFVEFEHEADMRSAYKNADGRRIEDRRIVVDVERGRTVDDWKPRRLGGGLGGTRNGGKDKNVRVTGRVGSMRVDDDRGSRRDNDRRGPPPRRDDRDRYGGGRDRDRRDDRGRRDDYRRPPPRDDRYGDRRRDDHRSGGRDDYRGGGRRDDRGGSRYEDRGRGPSRGGRGGGGHNPNMEPLGKRY